MSDPKIFSIADRKCEICGEIADNYLTGFNYASWRCTECLVGKSVKQKEKPVSNEEYGEVE